MCSPKVIADELHMRLEKIKFVKTTEFKKAFKDLYATITNIDNVSKANTAKINELTKEIKNYKKLYLKTNDKDYKDSAIAYMSLLNKLQIMDETLKNKRVEVLNQKADLEKKLSLFNITWNIKNAEITLFINEYILTKTVDVNTDIDLRSLEEEFTIKTNECAIDNMVDNAMRGVSCAAGDVTDATLENIDELEKQFDNILI